MAHYCEIDSNNMVVSVFVGRDEDDLADGVDDWESYYTRPGFSVKRTSYNTHGNIHLLGGEPFRFNYGATGFSYDEVRDAFIPPKPYDSWVLDEVTCLWVAPIPYPEEVDADGEPIAYGWDEEAGDWVAADE